MNLNNLQIVFAIDSHTLRQLLNNKFFYIYTKHPYFVILNYCRVELKNQLRNKKNVNVRERGKIFLIFLI
ncbi:hypothetical protein BpHYR1_011238 [Brachionus plicatilis]|uniref:Uncharacterized protein n=1 Tax=Brachionus plicatilis TaxID=10195 RepID=A0A3M7SNN4_BRAPC|nr:hypothetical protein BpHYR1_011238 [Brachionus plicatilis]